MTLPRAEDFKKSLALRSRRLEASPLSDLEVSCEAQRILKRDQRVVFHVAALSFLAAAFTFTFTSSLLTHRCALLLCLLHVSLLELLAVPRAPAFPSSPASGVTRNRS